MMGAVGGKTNQVWYTRTLHINGRNNGDVREMAPAEERIIERNDIARREVIEHVECRRDRVRHRAEVDRNVSRLGHEPSLALEERAGEVPPLLDVWRIAAAGQHCPHFLGNSG